MLGMHIAVWGPPASGKTTLAAILADRLGLPHVEMDALFWKPDWVASSLDEFRAAVAAALAACSGGWVMDGNYSRVQDLVLPGADTVVWFQPPLFQVLWRAVRRDFRHCRSGEFLWGINRVTWRRSLFSRESLAWYIMRNWRRFPRKRRETLSALPHHARIIVLRSRCDVERFLRDLDALPPAGG